VSKDVVAQARSASLPWRPQKLELKTCWLGHEFKPYGWMIVDEHTGRIMVRSIAHFRKPQEAWIAGLSALDQMVMDRLSAKFAAPTLPQTRVPSGSQTANA
jgi:hypothetical protein